MISSRIWIIITWPMIAHLLFLSHLVCKATFISLLLICSFRAFAYCNGLFLIVLQSIKLNIISGIGSTLVMNVWMNLLLICVKSEERWFCMYCFRVILDFLVGLRWGHDSKRLFSCLLNMLLLRLGLCVWILRPKGLGLEVRSRLRWERIRWRSCCNSAHDELYLSARHLTDYFPNIRIVNMLRVKSRRWRSFGTNSMLDYVGRGVVILAIDAHRRDSSWSL